MKELNLKHEAKRYGCAVLAATIMALNIKTFVRAGGLFPGGFTGLTLLIQNIFQTFMGIAVPYTLINVLLNSIPVFIGLKFIGKKFTISFHQIQNLWIAYCLLFRLLYQSLSDW